jgi:hypothetical protein
MVLVVWPWLIVFKRKYSLISNSESISIFQKIEILFMERKKGIFPAQHQPTSNMDTFYAATPLNAKGTCFRLVIVAEPTKTPKHIKTAAKKN